ncbi:MAG: helix-hairpin-helix domain-containing protein [Desulfobacterales bacterium]|nr:helix-hairpin-helix domain-containing protein [Desulfobacterales bacterium]
MKQMKSRIGFLVAVTGLLFLLVTPMAFAGGHKVNINTADKSQLMTLKYVGEKLAEKIMAYRDKQPFKNIEEIMMVKGIGQKVFEANKNKIIVADEQ